MPYVPENQRTTAYYLFEKKFMCRVPPLATRSTEDVKEFGVFSTGDAVVDREMSKDWVNRWMNIAQMEDCYNRGYSVKVVNYNDTKAIYEHIHNHLVAWRDFFQAVENNRVPQETLDELLRLDVFASEVYKPAKHLITRELSGSVLGRHLRKRGSGSLLSRSSFNRRDEPREDPQGDPNKSVDPIQFKIEQHQASFPKRHSLTDVFESQIRNQER